MKPKLVSFKLCPFVQRAVIALNLKEVDYEIEYIDLEQPPEWFLKISPLKKVPLLRIGGDVIFESVVILEYLDEAYPSPHLHPTDLVKKAKNRSWIEFGGSCMMDSYLMGISDNKAGFQRSLNELNEKFDQLEQVITGPYFNGQELSMVDVSYAPLMQRISFVDELKPIIFDSKRHPRINAWKDRLLNLDVVKTSTVLDIKPLYQAMLKKRNSYIVCS